MNDPPRKSDDAEVAAAYLAGHLGQRSRDLGNAHAVGIRHDGNHQTSVGVDRDADVDVVLVDDLLVFLIDDCVDVG